MSQQDLAAVEARVAPLLAAAGLGAGTLSVEPCAQGGNNQVFRIRLGGTTLAAKLYFRDASDGRDRLGAEFAFLEYARKAGIDCVPAALARDDGNGLALYEFIEGDKLAPGELRDEHVERALDFFSRLNAPAARLSAGALPDASEARFSISEQLSLTETRIERLAQIGGETDVDRMAVATAGRLKAAWPDLRRRVLLECGRSRLDPEALLDRSDRCVSPSDFGFHNALVAAGGKLAFIDFEYAGWDDPAKAVCDFFCQPAIEVSSRYMERFTRQALAFSPNASLLAERTRLLLPVFRMKWCCIMMNHFLPGYRARRLALPGLAEAARKKVQLDKVESALSVIGI
jgi:hypothetical protein